MSEFKLLDRVILDRKTALLGRIVELPKNAHMSDNSRWFYGILLDNRVTGYGGPSDVTFVRAERLKLATIVDEVAALCVNISALDRKS